MNAFQNATLTLIALLALSSADPANARPSVIITIDVESRTGLPLPIQVDSNCTDGSPCGLSQIARLLEERSLAGTFFLNVYEHEAWGEEAVREIATGLESRGHDVALHTHPQWAYDPDRSNMYDYSLEEQSEIIRDGRDLLVKWTRLPVVAHRAGAYSANPDTLVALERNGILLDSSWFLDHPNSRLADATLLNNLPSRSGQVTEVPVTVYARQERPWLLGRLAPALSSVRKLDPNWFVDETEAQAAIDATMSTDAPYLIFFLHSYSLMTEDSTEDRMTHNSRAEAIFASMLDHVMAEGLEVRTFRQLAEAPILISPGARDEVPAVVTTTADWNYLAHALGRERLLLLGGSVALALLGLGYLLYRQPQRRDS